ncbi:MAG: transposase, partial [Thermoleophilaceae bacterium]|nr:transposase [Thermoleophilaceae bacterium]
MAIPRLRTFLEPRKRSERALLAVVQEAYANGVSTRRSIASSSSSASPACR